MPRVVGTMLTKAADLSGAREAAGVSLEEIAERTKIAVRHLRGLEVGHLDGWPPGIYARAYARAYAAEVGLDPADVVEFVEAVMTPTEAPTAAEPPAPSPLGHGPIEWLWQAVALWRRPQQA